MNKNTKHEPAMKRERGNRDIDLGLAILETIAEPGQRFTQDEIASVCGCSTAYIYLIERRALQKLRNRFLFMKDSRLREMAESFFNHRTPAVSANAQHLHKH